MLTYFLFNYFYLLLPYLTNLHAYLLLTYLHAYLFITYLITFYLLLIHF